MCFLAILCANISLSARWSHTSTVNMNISGIHQGMLRMYGESDLYFRCGSFQRLVCVTFCRAYGNFPVCCVLSVMLLQMQILFIYLCIISIIISWHGDGVKKKDDKQDKLAMLLSTILIRETYQFSHLCIHQQPYYEFFFK